MEFMQLQRMADDCSSNLGGLYVAIEEIAAVYFVRDLGHGFCRIVLRSGKEFTVAESTSEMTERLVQYHCKQLKHGEV